MLKLYNITTAMMMLLVFAGVPVRALDANNPFLDLPSRLPPSLIEDIEVIAIFDVVSGEIRFSPVLIDNHNIEREVWREETQSIVPSIVLLTQVVDPRTGLEALGCYCTGLLGTSEYLISEIPVLNETSTGYVSVNDESYKAVMELIDYPHVQTELNTVSFSELVYVYHHDAIAQFLARKGFTLEQSWGFMGSENYPGVHDSQFFIARQTSTGQYYLVIRGTSGGADVATSTRVDFVPWGKNGRALQGYAEVASHIWAELTDWFDEFSASGQPLIITGHSLGGAVAILNSIQFLEAGLPFETYAYAPAPIGDTELFRHYQELLGNRVTNYFLPNEELLATQQDRATEHVRVLGQTVMLENVGTTAGAAHFVINYLKSMLLKHDYSRDWYEASMPHCVVVKYACFADSEQGTFAENLARYVPLCAFMDDACRERAALHLRGYRKGEVSGATLSALARAKKISLAERRLDPVQTTLIYFQLASIHGVLIENELADRYNLRYEALLGELTKP